MKSESSTKEAETSKVRVLVCDDHSIVREALTTVLNASSSFKVTAQTEGFDDTIELLTDTDVDAVVLDIRLKGTSGLELAKRLRQDAPSVRILLLTGFLNDEILLEAEAIGVDGIMDKSSPPEDIVERLTSVVTGSRRMGFTVPLEVKRRLDERGVLALLSLSRTDLEILELLGQGMTDKQISQRVFLGAQTVRNRVSRMLTVLGRENRTQLALLFNGLDESARAMIFGSRSSTGTFVQQSTKVSQTIAGSLGVPAIEGAIRVSVDVRHQGTNLVDPEHAEDADQLMGDVPQVGHG
jgi:two-component system response regulator DevR